jgi:hypothetical protein
MPEARLTWHAGSVLPYASLWHTILRASALNALHARDLPSATRRRAGAVDLLDNRAGAIDIPTLARELGEPLAAFQWSTLDRLPDPLRIALVAPRPRLCLACLTAGYHAALFSIELLDVCPIHGTPFVDQCRCGAPFHSILRSHADFGTAGSCQCGRLHFFTRETCRRPTMTPDMTRALAPLVAWLQALSRLIRPLLLDDALRRRAPGSAQWLVTTAHTLGVAYPACLRPVITPSTPVETTRYGSRPSSVSGRTVTSEAPKLEVSPYWRSQAMPATTVYRALARHVRRHLAPGSSRWVARFMDSGDPLVIAGMMRTVEHARRAFTEMLWAHTIEVGVEQRRWPDRRPAPGSVADFAAFVHDGCQVCGAHRLDAQAQDWLAGHAARAILTAVWREADVQTTAAVHSGMAVWAGAAPDHPWSGGVWLARATPRGLRFAAPVTASWSAATWSNKTARRLAWVEHRQARREAMWTACRGACLTWSEEAGWHVTDASAPADLDLRRRHLLGMKNGRPRCWLYRAGDGRFVARYDQSRLQVLAATPAAAITALRRCAIEYQRICQIALPFTPLTPLVVPELMDARLTADYHYFVEVVRCQKGFWREAAILADAARFIFDPVSRSGETSDHENT